MTSQDQTGPGFQSAKKNALGLGDSTKRVGEIAAGVLASNVFARIGSAAGAAFTDSIRAASDLEQAVGGTEAVFGAAGDVIDNFAERAAEAVGLSEAEFRNLTTLVGGQLKRMTGDVDLAANASIRLTEIAADLAATYGGTTRQAMEAFGSALRGEADPAERFNLNLKISAVNAKAVEMGLAATTGAVDENARAQATLALITEQSADAQGQFAEEADTLAVSQQKANAELENAKAQLGDELLPAVTAVTEAFAGMAGAVGDFLEKTRPIRDVFGDTIGKLLDADREILEFLGIMEEGSDATKTFTRVTKEQGDQAVVTAGQTEDLAERIKSAEEAAKDAEQAIRDLTNALFESGNEAITLEEKQDALADAIDRAKEASKDDDATKRDQRAALRDVAEASHALIETMVEQGASTEDVRGKTESARRKFIEVATAMLGDAEAAEDLADKYGLIPEDVETQVDLIGAERAKQKAAEVAAAIARIQSKTVYIDVNQRVYRTGGGGYIPEYAHGGIVGSAQGGGPRGNRVLVGEHRPEVVELPVGSRVIPSVDQAMDRGQTWAGMGGELVVRLEVDGAEDAFVEALRRALRVRGYQLGTRATA